LLFEVLNGEELDCYRLQLKTYVVSGRPLGKSHVIVKRKPHNIWVDVYVSGPLETVFPLMHHFNRKGEPTEAYKKQLEEYLEQIQGQEEKI
jgi:hypothetical protein